MPQETRTPILKPLAALTSVFVILKLLGAITWSWLWVLCPLWLPLAATLAVFALVAAIGVLVLAYSIIGIALSREPASARNATQQA